MKKIVPAVVLAVIVLVAVAATGCGGSSTSSSSSSGSSTKPKSSGGNTATNVTVKDVSTNPQAYDGQEVTTEGNYAVGYCSACFLLKDGVSALRVEVTDQAPLPPESKLNSRMQVTGKIYLAQGSPNLIADEIVYK